MVTNKGTIVYIGAFELPDKNAAAHRVINNSKIFYELGYKVVFLGADKDIKEDVYEPIKGAFYDSYPYKYPFNLFEWIKCLFGFKHLKTILDSVDDLKYVIAYNMHASPFKKVMKYCKKRNIKVVTDITEWYENKFSLSPIKFIKHFDTKKVMEKLNKKVDGAIVISSYLKNYYEKSIKNIVMIPPLVDLQEDIWNQQTKKSETINFIFNGFVEKGKEDIGLTIECFLDLKDDCHLKVLGITKEEFCEMYPHLAHLVDLSKDKVSFYGPIPHKESVKQLLESDYCFIVRQSSRKNNAGFSTKFVESVTAGITIVATKTGDMENYKDKANIIFLNSTNIDEIRKCIVSCSKLPKRKDHLLNDCFDYHKYKTTINEFFNSLN